MIRDTLKACCMVNAAIALGHDGRDSAERELQHSEEEQEYLDFQYDFFGDCVGLSPLIFGEEAGYVQSDLQFALQVSEGVREFVYEQEDGVSTLPPEISLELMARYFESEYVDKDGVTRKQMQASSV